MNQVSSPPKKIAAIITEYRPLSHADVIVGKYLEGFNQDERPPYPHSKIVSMFTEQVPKQDISRDRAKKFHVPIFRTAADALTMGGDKLAVDGVLLIGEHGDYPTNDKEQKLYPRFEMFLKITDVFRQSGRSVPMFNDKHLSWNFRQAKRMVDISHELRFPMLAGSSAPVAQRIPAVDTPFGDKQNHAVAISYSGIDITDSMCSRRCNRWWIAGRAGKREYDPFSACRIRLAELYRGEWLGEEAVRYSLTRSNTRKTGNPRRPCERTDRLHH